VLVAVVFVAWSAALTANWWQTAQHLDRAVAWWPRTGEIDQTLIVLGFVLVAGLVWFGLLSAVAGSATGAGFGMVAAVVWWGLRYLGRIGDGFPGWFLLGQDLWGVGLVCCVVISKVLPWHPAPTKQVDAKIYTTKEWGTPGQPMAATASFGADDPAAARDADCQVAQRLKDLVTQDSARFIHGLRFTPGGTIAVDHAVVVGSRVALIEVKLWQPGIYSCDGPLAVLYYGERFRGGSVELSTAASLCRAQLGPDVDVRAWIVVVPGGEPDRHTYVLDNTGAPEGIDLCRTDDLDTVREWLADARNEIDPSLVQTLVRAHKLHLASTKPTPGAAHPRNRVKVLPGHSTSRAPGK